MPMQFSILSLSFSSFRWKFQWHSFAIVLFHVSWWAVRAHARTHPKAHTFHSLIFILPITKTRYKIVAVYILFLISMHADTSIQHYSREEQYTKKRERERVHSKRRKRGIWKMEKRAFTGARYWHQFMKINIWICIHAFFNSLRISAEHSITSWLYILGFPFGCCKIQFKMLFESTSALHCDSKQNMQVARCALMHIFWIKAILIAFWIEMDAYFVFICSSSSNKQTKRRKWCLSKTKRIAHAANLQITNCSDWIIKVIIGCVRVRVRIALFVRNLNRSPGLNGPSNLW